MSLVSLARMSFANLKIDAPASKRKPSSSSGHFGERADSAQMAVRLIALSRVLLTKDAAVLSTVATSLRGSQLLRALMAATLRLAVLVTTKKGGGGGKGQGDPASSSSDKTINMGNIATLFNVTGSTLSRQSSFEALFGLPDKISWNDARSVYAALLDALAYARTTPSGAAVESLIMSNTPEPGASPEAVIDTFVTEMEERAIHRLRTAPRLGVTSYTSSSSSSSSSFTSTSSTTATTTTETTPHSDPSPVPTPSYVPPFALPPAQEPFRIDPTASLLSNLMRLVERHVVLLDDSTQSSSSTISAAFEEGSSLLMPTATAARRREMLASNVLTALAHQGMAWLWACTIDAASGDSTSVNSMAMSIVNSCSATAASMFADAELQAAFGL